MSIKLDDSAIGKLLFELESLSKYKKGQAIDTMSEYTSVKDVSYKVKLDRSLNGDSRTLAISRIQDKINELYCYGECICESKYLTIYERAVGRHVVIEVEDLQLYMSRMELLIKIMMSIKSATCMLDELEKNYIEDANTVGRCRSLKKDVETKSFCLEEKIKKIDMTKKSFEVVNVEGIY
jgi:hypothetical protein